MLANGKPHLDNRKSPSKFRPTHLNSDLSIISSVQGHPLVPEMFEERGEDLVFDVLWFYTICGTTLLHHLQTHRQTYSETVRGGQRPCQALHYFSRTNQNISKVDSIATCNAKSYKHHPSLA